MLRRFFLVCLSFSLPLPLAAAEWPQWRGPNRDGHAPGAKLPAKWPAEAPKPLWTGPVGVGDSGPVTAGGKVFVMGRENGSERCLCLDADTGKQLWKIEYPEEFEPPDPTAGKGPSSTPAVDRDRVYF